jgi:hypothetical protein
MTPQGINAGNNHDVGERISWTLRPVVSTKINRITYEDGYKEDYPETRQLPKIGDKVDTIEYTVENEALVKKTVNRTVKNILSWQDRRKNMKGVCLNCHNDTYIDNFYKQYDSLVTLYNEKFALPAQDFMNKLTADKVLNPNAPFEHEVQWVFYELWHHEGRRARHGASMMGPDYTHWHGMYEVSKHYYQKFLPEVINAAATKGPAMKQKYEELIRAHLAKEEHVWQKGLKPEEAEALRKMYESRYK